MVVDDHHDVLTMYTEFLAMSGFDTCGTSTAMHAIEMAVRERPDVILTDLNMPFVDGWTIVRTLKEHPLTAHIPIVVLTGDADALTSERADASKCSAFLTKPCLPQVMADTLRSVLVAAAAVPVEG